MVTKKSTASEKAGRGIEGEKGEGVAGESAAVSGGSGRMLVFAAVGIIAACVIIAVALMQPAQEKLPGFEEVYYGMADAVENADNMLIDGNINVDMDTGILGKISMDSNVTLEYDVKNKKGRNSINATIGGGTLGTRKANIEYYLINDSIYIKVEAQGGEDAGGQWMRIDGENLWGDGSPLGGENLNLSELLDLVDGRVIERGSLNGKKAIKLSIKPDMGAIIDYMVKEQAAELGVAGINESEINRVKGLLDDSIESMDFYVWVDEDYKPIAMEGNFSIKLDMSKIYGQYLSGSMDITGSFELGIEYGAASISLPEEAKNAQYLNLNTYGNQGYAGPGGAEQGEPESVCGDGWCDWNEDSIGCPEDCYCGDGWCDIGENETNCPGDCAYDMDLNQSQALI